MTPSLTLFFIVEPPQYQYYACFLAASIRSHLDPEITLVGYCPAQKIDRLDPAVVTALDRMRCEIRPMQTEGMFDPPYPHGNKLVACLQPRETDWGGFLDSDILVVAGHDIRRLFAPDHVTCTVATSIGWAPDWLWDTVYDACGMPVPEDRVYLSRKPRDPVPPYFNSGIVIFPEGYRSANGQSFAETWMEVAQTVDAVDSLAPFCRPYLDQITLPVAMKRAGLGWNELAQKDHFILGGRMRHSAVPIDEMGITTVHYRNWGLLQTADLTDRAQDELERQVGVRRVRELADEARPPAATLDFAPDRSICAPPILEHEVTLVPWSVQEPGETRRAAGLLAADGRFLPSGHCWRNHAAPLTMAPDRPKTAPQDRLAGRWLYGGMFDPHFGRFLTETTSRLWAADGQKALAGLVFLPAQEARNERRLYRHQLPILAALGLSHLPVRVPQTPVTIEELVIPDPAFGTADMIAGRPDYRDWMARSLGAIEPAVDGPRDLYVSRSALPEIERRTLIETRIDALMQEGGYTVYHPETQSFAEQVATYKAARRIVALDGAALHLAAMAVAPDTEVAIIARGPSSNIDDYITQFRAFAGIDPLRIDAPRGHFHPAGRRVVDADTHAVLDMAHIGLNLAASGFIPSALGWEASFEDQIEAEQRDLERRMKTKLDWHTT
ncbi:hypothetical protein roselon_02052 [Roseibacterium elongatum DSM 19469]|uniref:Glycosyltransferase 61 catalytic domain-containing protein n=1 Tax=Roseicyclus elongatus DSM 19469 TaxID=1294273 RepID=W8RTC6_9RHOB|nr:glycosyltransferase 61 family protein [Roseibacterium elongatum]AHM04403.1 hypothetical protein roselon_02052 [Roseibacterium elongatum DSM 19469]